MHTLIFPSKIWTKKYTSYMAKYGAYVIVFNLKNKEA